MYAVVIIPLKLSNFYTYKVPKELLNNIQVGSRVLVQFGNYKFYSAIVYQLKETTEDKYQYKDILELIDSEPIIFPNNLILWNFISQYYLNNIGSVMDLAIPSFLKLNSEKYYIINDELSDIENDLTGKELELYNFILESKKLELKDLYNFAGNKTNIKTLNNLLKRNFILQKDEIKDKYLPKKALFLKLNDKILKDNILLNKLFDEYRNKSEKKYNLLLEYFKLAKNGNFVDKKILLSNSSVSTGMLKSLIDKGIFEQSYLQKSRINDDTITINKEVELSKTQQIAYNQIHELLESKNIVLFRGITGCGKTEIYIKLISDYLALNKKCVLILPEITLTTQIQERLSTYFRGDLVIYHSNINPNSKIDIWNNVLQNKYNLIIGTRSILFLPFKQLDFVLIDEEHDKSLRQQDNHPKYNARDCFIYYSKILNFKLLLASATPSVESFYNKSIGKFGYVELLNRYKDANLPKIVIIDLKEQHNKTTMISSYSKILYDEIQNSIDNNHQTIIFQNRRGYSPFLMCNVCFHIPKCKKCDVRLTYHITNNYLLCHYCYSNYKMLNECPNCNHTPMSTKGLGTQKIEEEIPLLFNNAKVERLDTDNTKSLSKLKEVLEKFKNNKSNILVGTQIVTKGLDFDNLEIIGILNVDNLFTFSDYKTNERAFQTLTQVCGRAGRRKEISGKVFIQSLNPKDPLLQKIINYDYLNFVNEELKSRKEFLYPPFICLIKLIIKHKNQEILNIYSKRLYQKLSLQIKSFVIGPSTPNISRINNFYIQEIFIKLKKDTELKDNKSKIVDIINHEIFLISNNNFVIEYIVDY